MIPVAPKPSLQGRLALIWSGDPSLQPRPEDEAQAAQWDKDLEVCQETGQWERLLVAGSTPTMFKFELPRGTAKRKLMDLVGNMAGSANYELAALFVRATVREVTGFGDFKLQFQRDRTLGLDLATDVLVEALDAIDLGIVLELATVAIQRFSRVPGN